MGYSSAVERHMQHLFHSLSEKDRRRYAAVEAEKLGHGGMQYISELFGCDPYTIRHGAEEIAELPAEEAEGRIRKRGGASQLAAQAELVPAVEALIERNTAGSPVDANRWTNQPVVEIAEALQDQGFEIGVDALRRILSDELNVSRRQAFKDEATCHFDPRRKVSIPGRTSASTNGGNGQCSASTQKRRKSSAISFIRAGR